MKKKTIVCLVLVGTLIVAGCGKKEIAVTADELINGFQQSVRESDGFSYEGEVSLSMVLTTADEELSIDVTEHRKTEAAKDGTEHSSIDLTVVTNGETKSSAMEEYRVPEAAGYRVYRSSGVGGLATMREPSSRIGEEIPWKGGLTLTEEEDAYYIGGTIDLTALHEEAVEGSVPVLIRFAKDGTMDYIQLDMRDAAVERVVEAVQETLNVTGGDLDLSGYVDVRVDNLIITLNEFDFDEEVVVTLPDEVKELPVE